MLCYFFAFFRRCEEFSAWKWWGRKLSYHGVFPIQPVWLLTLEYLTPLVITPQAPLSWQRIQLCNMRQHYVTNVRIDRAYLALVLQLHKYLCKLYCCYKFEFPKSEVILHCTDSNGQCTIDYTLLHVHTTPQCNLTFYIAFKSFQSRSALVFL